MDSVRSSPFGQIFRPDNFVFGQSGAGKYLEVEAMRIILLFDPTIVINSFQVTTGPRVTTQRVLSL